METFIFSCQSFIIHGSHSVDALASTLEFDFKKIVSFLIDNIFVVYGMVIKSSNRLL
jgi:hypothetical protein